MKSCLLSYPDFTGIASGGESGFEGKTTGLCQQLFNPAQHDSAGFECHFFRLKRRQAFGNFIGIDKLPDFQYVRQNGVGSRSFTGTVASCYNVEILFQIANED